MWSADRQKILLMIQQVSCHGTCIHVEICNDFFARNQFTAKQIFRELELEAKKPKMLGEMGSWWPPV